MRTCLRLQLQSMQADSVQLTARSLPTNRRQTWTKALATTGLQCQIPPNSPQETSLPKSLHITVHNLKCFPSPKPFQVVARFHHKQMKPFPGVTTKPMTQLLRQMCTRCQSMSSTLIKASETNSTSCATYSRKKTKIRRPLTRSAA